MVLCREVVVVTWCPICYAVRLSAAKGTYGANNSVNRWMMASFCMSLLGVYTFCSATSPERGWYKDCIQFHDPSYTKRDEVAYTQRHAKSGNDLTEVGYLERILPML
jgi:hypothetical protein